jgi:hypothetical protein
MKIEKIYVSSTKQGAQKAQNTKAQKATILSVVASL